MKDLPTVLSQKESRKTDQSRSFCFTFNNYDDSVVVHFMDMYYSQQPKISYICLGFEVGKKGTPHIQGYMYIPGKIRFKTLLKKCPHGTHLEIARANDPKYAYEYCFKDGDYHEMGERPMKNGVNKSVPLGHQIIEAIKAGMSISEAYVQFPSYMLMHGSKVKAYFNEIQVTPDTEFYVIEPVIDVVDECMAYFENLPDLAVVTELKQLSGYKLFKNIIYIPQFEIGSDYILHNLWARNLSPITYSYGYETKVVMCDRFIISTKAIERYGSYETIPNMGVRDGGEDIEDKDLIGPLEIKDKLVAASRRKVAADVNHKKVLYEANLEKRKKIFNKSDGKI